jgi:hypothetical protein
MRNSYFDIFVGDGGQRETRDDGLKGTSGFMRVVLDFVEG